MRRSIKRMIYMGMIFSLLSSLCFAAEIDSRYATLIYRDEGQLSEFSKKALNAVSFNETNTVLADYVRNKIDLLVERCIKILLDAPYGEHPRFKIIILVSTAEVQKIYSQKYGKGVDYIAFYSPQVDTVFISVDALEQGILAHEIAHVIIQHYFCDVPSREINETLARMVETQLEQ